MPIILKNNVDSTLAQAISASETAAIVTAGDGAKFPALGAGDYFYATLVSAQGTREIVKVTSKSIDTLAITRAQEGTTANGFAVGSRVEMRVTAASITDLVDEHDQASEITIADAGGYYTSGTAEGALQEVGGTLRTQAAQERDTVAALLADTVLTYTAGQPGTVTAGNIVRTRAEGFAYAVAASGASNQHVTTAGGVKLYVQPGETAVPRIAQSADVSKFIAMQSSFTSGLTATIPTKITQNGGYLRIEGYGDAAPISVVSDGIDYNGNVFGGIFDDHAHRIVENLRLVGPGVSDPAAGTLFKYDGPSGSYVHFGYNVFQGGDIGLDLSNCYTNSGFKNHYTQNRIGLRLNSITSHIEQACYIRGSNDTTNGAAVLIEGFSTENIAFLGGAIEGNRAPAVKVNGTDMQDDFCHLHFWDTYFELDGNLATGTPSIDIPNTIGDGAKVSFIGGKLSYNVLPSHPGGSWTSGDYILGRNATFEGTIVAGSIFVDYVSIGGATLLRDCRFNDQQEPTYIINWGHVTTLAGWANVGGYLFQCALAGRTVGNSPIPNKAVLTYPHLSASVSGAPAISENTADDYGDGSWTRATFNPVVGSSSSNSVLSLVGVNGRLSGSKPGGVYSFLIKTDRDTVLSISETGNGQRMSSQHEFKAGKTYKIAAMVNKNVGGTTNYLVIWPTAGDAPVIDYLPIVYSEFDTMHEASAFMGRVVRG